MLPSILSHLGSEGLSHLKRLASNVAANNRILSTLGEEKDDIPELVENFENAMNAGTSSEVSVEAAKSAPVEVVD